MALKIGNNAVANAFVGTSQVRRAYKGGTLVYQGWGPSSEREFVQLTSPGGPAQLLKVYGKSIVFRQLRRDSATTFTADGVTTSYDASTGKVCIHNDSRTSPYSSGSTQLYLTDATFPALVGHKIAILFSVQDSSIGVTNPSGIYFGSTIMTLTNAMLRLRIDATYDFVNAHPVGSDYYFYVNFIDLTDYFGAGNEPTTIAEVRKYFPADYYPYDPGSLQSNKTSLLQAERVPVINVWDEEWETGRYNNTTGAKEPANDRIRNANLIAVLPSTQYYKNALVSNVYYYDINKQFISYGNTNDRIFTTPANCYYIAWMTFSTYGNTYQNDICINISDPAINGQYFPHWRGSLALNLSTLTSGGVAVFPDGMRGVGSIRDEAYGSTGVVRFGKRAYQAGDESDTSVLTDGTNTIYPLATPLTYTLDTPLPTDLTCEQGDILQRVSDNNCPFVGEMKFGL